MQVLLTFIGANAGYVSIGALTLSVFCAGSFLQGERVRKEEIRDQMREIEALTEETMARVASITATLEAEDQRLVAEIENTYQELAVLNAEEAAARRALAERQRAIERPRQPTQPRTGPAFQGFTIRPN
jgi:predicted oxidoreductase